MRSAGGETVPLPTVEDALLGLEQRLLELTPEARRAFALVLPRVRELRDLVAVAARPNWDYLRQKLREVDQAVGDMAPQALDPEGARAIEAGVPSGRPSGTRGGWTRRPSKSALHRLTRARARERLKLPRVDVL